MEIAKLAIPGLNAEQNDQLNRIYRKLKRDSASAQEKIIEFAQKLATTMHPLNDLGWSESMFKYAATVEVNRPYINNIEGALVDLDNAESADARAEVYERFIKFVDGFEDSLKTRLAGAIAGQSFGTMQTNNLAEHYKAGAIADLINIYY